MTSAQSHDHQQLHCGERLNIRCCQLLVLAVVCLVLLGKKKSEKQTNELAKSRRVKLSVTTKERERVSVTTIAKSAAVGLLNVGKC